VRAYVNSNGNGPKEQGPEKRVLIIEEVRDTPMEKLIGCSLAASLLFFSASTKSGNTPVGAELVAAGRPYTP
jgi:hypothetical protein